MGFRDWVKRTFGSPSNSSAGYLEEAKETQKIEQLNFVSDDETQSYEKSFVGQIDIMKSNLLTISTVLPKQADELEQRIQSVQEKLNTAMAEFEVQADFNELKDLYDKTLRMAEGEYIINELKKQTKNMNINFKQNLEDEELSQKVLAYQGYISKLQTRISEAEKAGAPILTGVQRQRFNSSSLEAEYRMRMLAFMDKKDKRIFANLPSIKQEVFGGYFLQDLKEVCADCDGLRIYRDLIDRNSSITYSSIDKKTDKILDDLSDILVTESFSIKEVFDTNSDRIDTYKVLSDFVDSRKALNEMRASIGIYQENEKKRKEREEKREQERLEQERVKAEKEALAEKEKNKYKNMTDEEIQAEIDKIERDLSATGSRYVNILDFQKKVAREKGILTNEDEFNRSNLAYINVTASKLQEMMRYANEEGVNYTVFPDSQEYGQEKYLFVVSGSDESKVNKEMANPFEKYEDARSYNTRNYDSKTGYEYGRQSEWLGRYTPSVANLLYGKLEELKRNRMSLELDMHYIQNKKNNLYFRSGHNDTLDGYCRRKSAIMESIQTVYDGLQTRKGKPLDDKDIKCYINVPAQRNIIPILTKLNESNIPFYFEPEPSGNRNQKNRDFIHVYFDRANLDKYLTKVQPYIQKKGYATLGGVDINLNQDIVNECKWPEGVLKRNYH